MAGITRQTAAAYKHVLNEVIKPVARVVTARITPHAGDVKYGAHQVTAGLLEGGNISSAPCSSAVLSVDLGIDPIFDG
jgi:hypothetical protein